MAALRAGGPAPSRTGRPLRPSGRRGGTLVLRVVRDGGVGGLDVRLVCPVVGHAVDREQVARLTVGDQFAGSELAGPTERGAIPGEEPLVATGATLAGETPRRSGASARLRIPCGSAVWSTSRVLGPTRLSVEADRSGDAAVCCGCVVVGSGTLRFHVKRRFRAAIFLRGENRAVQSGRESKTDSKNHVLMRIRIRKRPRTVA